MSNDTPTREQVEALAALDWTVEPQPDFKPGPGMTQAQRIIAAIQHVEAHILDQGGEGTMAHVVCLADAEQIVILPTLARAYLATLDRAEAAERRVVELEAVLAAERGEPAGALPGWQYDFNVASWTRDDGEHLLTARRVNHNTWASALQNMRTGDMLDYCEPPTARDAMKAADAALRAVTGRDT